MKLEKIDWNNKKDCPFSYFKKTPLNLIYLFRKFKNKMIIEKTKNTISFKLSRSFKIDELQDITNLLEFMEISKKSKANQSKVDELVNQIKKGRWAKTKSKIKG